MYYHCEICDIINRYELKVKRLKSDCPKHFELFTITRYIIEKPDVDNLTKTLKKYVDIHIKKYYSYRIICVFRVNDDHSIRHRPLTNRDFESENINIECKFSQIDEMRTSFDSCRKLMTYNCCITQPMQAIARKLNQNITKNPKLTGSLTISFIPLAYIRKYAHLCSDYNDQLFDIILSLV